MEFTKYLTKFKTTNGTQTHLSLKGGCYNVPDEQLASFNLEYFNAVYKNNFEAFLVEKIYDRKFKFFLDIERPSNNEDTPQLTDDTIIKILNEVSEIVDSRDYIVSKNLDKTRYHAVYYNTIVNKAVSIEIVNKISEEYGIYIDKSVYSTGLRMMGSKKADSNSIYVPYDLFTEKELKLTKGLFLKSTIHVPKKSTINVIFESDTSESSESETESTSKECKIKNISEEEKEEIEEILKQLSTKDIFNGMNLKPCSIVAKENKVGINCYYISIEEQFCPFKQRAHKRKNSPLYIEIKLNKAYIRCHDFDCEKSRIPEDGIVIDVSNCPNIEKSVCVKSKDNCINIDPETREILEAGLSLTHYKISKVIYHLYKNKYMISEPGRAGVWYMFDNHRWKISNKINIDISEDLPKYYNAIMSSTKESEDIKEYLENDDDNENAKRNKIIKKLKTSLEQVPFKDAILSQSRIIFNDADPDFFQRLDQTPYIIGFDNGVYDFNTCEFREGRTSDYLTFSTGYDYVEYDPTNKHTIELESIISKIIPNENVKRYLLTILAKALIGVPDERFYMFIGFSGANGKSTLINMLEYTLNDYMTSVEVSLLTCKRGSSSNASPEVMKMRGKRIISMQEPESEDIIHTGLLRQLTGNDTLVARELYKNCVSFKLQGTMIMCANELPEINSINEAVWRRIRVIDFPSRFVENPKRDNEYKIDRTLKQRMPTLAPYLMSLLIHYYTTYKDDASEPDEVLASTLKYNREANVFTEFIDNYTEQSNRYLQFSKISNCFKGYWNNLDTNERMPSSKDLKRALNIKYGIMKQGGYQLKLVSNDTDFDIIEDEEENDL